MLINIAVASAPYPHTVSEACGRIRQLAGEAAAASACIVCFPETYIPGYPAGADIIREERSKQKLEDTLQQVCRIAKEAAIAIIIPMDWYEGEDLLPEAKWEIIFPALEAALNYHATEAGT